MDAELKFRSDTTAPSEAAPSLACDCQVHVYGDPLHYPIRKQSSYKPFADADVDAALAMHRTLGLARGVIVQSTVHGTDHRILLDGLERAGKQYRGVAIINDEVSDHEIQRLHDAGVRGARFNFWKQLNIAPSPDEFRRSIQRIKAYGWVAKVHAAGDEWLEIRQLLDEVDIPIIVDHLGHVDISRGLNQPVVDMFRHYLTQRNWVMMLSNGDRHSKFESGWSDSAEFIKSIISIAPDRMIWCTDWPHVQYKKKIMPTDTELLELLYQAAPDPLQRQMILTSTPARIFQFDHP